MAMSDYLEGRILNHVLNGGSTPYTAPSPIYIALFTAAPSDTGGGTEVTGGSYARVSVTNGFTVSGIATRGGNTADTIFPASTAPWGTITHFGIFDAASGGNLLFHGPLTTPRVIGAGVISRFLANTLGVTLS